MQLDSIRNNAIAFIKESLGRNIEEKAKLEELVSDARKRVNIHYEEGDLRENSAYQQAIEDLTRYSNELSKKEQFIEEYDLSLLDKIIVSTGTVNVMSAVRLYEELECITYEFFISPFMESDLEKGYVSKDAALVKLLIGREVNDNIKFKDRVNPKHYNYVIKEIL